MRVVVSLTTIPSRIIHLNGILDVLRSQTYPIDQIYLNLPRLSKREKCPYPKIPSHINLDRVTVVKCDDHGPITKLYPSLEKENDPDTIIITVDDDVKYSTDRVSTLVKYCRRYPDAAIGGSGFVIGTWYRFFGAVIHPEKITPVNVIEGWSGCAYRRRFFNKDLLNYEHAPDGSFYNDDIWISGYLSLQKTPRLICPGYIGDLNSLPGALSSDIMCIPRFVSTIMYLKNKGAFDEPVKEHLPFLSNFIFAGIVIIIVFIIILVYNFVYA